MKNNILKVAILGLGYVGFPLAQLLIKNTNYSVIGIDTDKEKIRIRNDELSSPRFRATADFSLLREVNIAVVCVPTPVKKNYQPDYDPLIGACRFIAKNIKKYSATRPLDHPAPLIIIESTINPGTCEEVVLPIFKKRGFVHGRDFLLAHCPERIDPGNKKWTLENIPRNVGGINGTAAEKAAQFYRSFLKGAVKMISSIKAAEATKIIENTFRDINIAYVNELAMSFDTLGIDLKEVIEGASSKPFAFMPHYPGIGVGGHCIKIDPYYLIERAHKSGFEHRFLKMAREVNNGMPRYAVKLLEKELAKQKLSLMGKNKIAVGILGLAYKKDIDDMRESPAAVALEILQKKGATIEVFDPFIPAHSTTKNIESLLRKCKAIILATNHTAFSKITPRLLKKFGVLIVIDGRNCLHKESILAAGIAYKGIGH